MARKRRSRVKHYLLPHRGNGYKPQLFAASSVAVIAIVLVLLQAAHFFATQVIFKESNFLASVLPGALVALTNSDRVALNLTELTEDATLARAAQLKADDMAAKGYFAHVSPEGYQPWHWLDAVGYDYSYAGENLAVNFTDSKDVETAWMNSPTHRANIVKPEYTRVGIATAQGMYKGEEVTFVVQLFATPPAAAASTPEPEVEEPAAPEPAPEIAVMTEEVPAIDAEILGEQVAPAAAAVAEAATSPTYTLIYILSALAVFILALLVIAFAVHVRIQYVEVMSGGLLLLLIVLGFLLYNASGMSRVEIPAEGQSASVVNAF